MRAFWNVKGSVIPHSVMGSDNDNTHFRCMHLIIFRNKSSVCQILLIQKRKYLIYTQSSDEVRQLHMQMFDGSQFFS